MNWLPQYAAALDDVVVADRPTRGTLVASGAEVVQVLQGVVTSDVFALAAEGSGQRSAAVNSTGRLVFEMRVVHVPDLLLMDFEPGAIEDGAASHLRANVITEDARFVDRTARTARLTVLGPRAADLVASTADLVRHPDTLSDWGATWGTLAQHDVIVQRIATFGIPAFELYFAADARESARTAFDAPAITEEALEALRIEAGVSRWGVELDEKVIPLETDLAAAVSYDKGCYVGQEIIARLDTLGTPARLLRTLVREDDGDDALQPGMTLLRDGKKVGDVRSVTYSPRLERQVALGFVKRNHNEPGTILDAGHTSLRVEPLGHPFSSKSSAVESK